jgi:hypothetical protein
MASVSFFKPAAVAGFELYGAIIAPFTLKSRRLLNIGNAGEPSTFSEAIH